MPMASVATEVTMPICLWARSSEAGTNIINATPTSGRNVPTVRSQLSLVSVCMSKTLRLP